MRARPLSARERLARLIALLLSLALLAGAWGSQLLGGLHPCEMCLWQRWPHYAAVVLAALAFFVGGPATRRTLVAGAAALIAISGLIGVFHAGVEWHWWPGITACSAGAGGDADPDAMLRRVLAAPIIRCDTAQWRLLGISLAGFNAVLSLAGAAVIAGMTRRTRR